MQIKWWFFYYQTTTITDTNIYHIKDLEDYGDIVLKNIYSLHKRGKHCLYSSIGLPSQMSALILESAFRTLAYPADFVEIETKGGRPIGIRQYKKALDAVSKKQSQ